jgi:hypothetical protein
MRPLELPRAFRLVTCVLGLNRYIHPRGVDPRTLICDSTFHCLATSRFAERPWGTPTTHRSRELEQTEGQAQKQIHAFVQVSGQETLRNLSKASKSRK